MKTVQMTLDEQLVRAVDSAATKLGTTRSGLTREALRSALKEVRLRELESKQRDGYRRKPVKRGEFSDWESEQCGVIDEARRGQMVCNFPDRTRDARCLS